MFLSRRHLLTSAATLASGAALSGSTIGSPAAAQPIVRSSGLDRLAKALKGRLLRPGEDGYAVAAWPNAGRWADVHPRAVALCTDPCEAR